MELLFITWNPNEGLGPFRWYGLCWLIGLALAYFIVRRLYKEQNVKDELFDPLFIYCFIGILLGARLGHCLFNMPVFLSRAPKRVIRFSRQRRRVSADMYAV